jgi:hypothetical protein
MKLFTFSTFRNFAIKYGVWQWDVLYVLKHMNIQIFKWGGFHLTLSYERWIEYVDSKQTRFSMPWNDEQEEDKDLATSLSIQVTRNLLHVWMRLDLGDEACMRCFDKELLGKWLLRRPRRRWEDNIKINIVDCEDGRWVERSSGSFDTGDLETTSLLLRVAG